MAIFTQIVPLAGALWPFNIPGGALSGMVGAAPWELSRCFFTFCFYLAAPGLTCITRHRLVVVCQLLVLAWDLVHQPEIKAGLLPREPGVLASGPPGKAQPPLPTPAVKCAGDASA